MRYELGNMDRYSMAANGTTMENASFFKVTLADGEAPGAVMQEWAMALAKANGLT